MYKQCARFLGWLFVLMGLAVPVLAQDLNTQAAHFKVRRFVVHWTLQSDASSVKEIEVEREALTPTGAQLIGKYAQQINPQLQTMELVKAYTQKPDGRQIPVSPDGIQVQKGIATALTGVSWPDGQIHQVTFADLQVGDRAYWHVRIHQHTPELPGWARFYEYLPPNMAFDEALIRIEAPQSLHLNLQSQGWRETRQQNGQNIVHLFERSQPEPRLVDPNGVNTFNAFPRVVASTLGEHTELGRLFDQKARAQVRVTDEVKRLAESITRQSQTDQDKAADIYRWMQRNIRYVAIYLGQGGWVPHSVEWILDKRYGDCKDHAVLMQALLLAVGIQADTVLLYAGNEFELPEWPVGFSHCMVYLPRWGLYLDSTSTETPFGQLHWLDADKPVVVVSEAGARLQRTPSTTPELNRALVRSRYRIEADGKGHGEVQVEAQGYAAIELKQQLERIPAGLTGMAVQRILESSGWRGKGFARYPRVRWDQTDQSLSLVDLQIDNFVANPSAGSFSVHPELRLPLYIRTRIGNYNAPSRSLAITCIPFQLREEFEIEWADSYHLLSLPPSLKLHHTSGIDYEAHIEREGQTVRGWRQFTQSNPHHACPPEVYAERRSTMHAITQHLARGVLYEQRP